MAEWNEHAATLSAAGARLAALSVDPPERSRRVAERLELGFPLVSDVEKRVVVSWRLLNARERGGVAKPAVFVVDGSRRVLARAFEGVSRRIAPADVLPVLARTERGVALSPHVVVPRVRDFLAAARASFARQ